MRRRLPGALLAAATLVAGPAFVQPAFAQVTVNPGALELLPAPKPQPNHTTRPPARPSARPAAQQPAPTHSPAAPPPAATQAAAPPPAPAPKPPPVPTIPPAVAAIPPPAPIPSPRPQPAPVVPVAADAPGAAAPLPNGLRITFGPDRQELNPVTEAALRAYARTVRADAALPLNLYAYAPGTPEDPSTSRRLSLARALAARGVLINEGIASTRIYPRALGPTGGDTDKDRVDIIAGPPGPPPGAAQAAATPATPK